MGFYCIEILHRTTSKNMGIFHNYVRHSSDLVCVCVCVCVCVYVCMYVCVCIYIYVQGVSGGIVNILGGGSMDYSE